MIKLFLIIRMTVGKNLPNVLSGGDTNSEKILTEDNIYYKLEPQESFMKLIENKKKTQDKN
ncbi:MAG: hypothetical protein CM15mP88_1390 [Pseudomonadota bacterium]|nr:MAG: hypothetical protein CM15mP88_1390 [Pseudomonadota bacterium]